MRRLKNRSACSWQVSTISNRLDKAIRLHGTDRDFYIGIWIKPSNKRLHTVFALRQGEWTRLCLELIYVSRISMPQSQ